MGASRTSKTLVALWCVLVWSGLERDARAASTVPNGPAQGQLYGITDRGPVLIPLESTEVSAHVTGSVASVTVKQQFRNPNAKPLEAIYVFPLPQGASVHHMSLRARGKVIKGEIRRRSEVRAIYEMAKKAGKTVALIDQERPNIFTQQIANIFPKSNVEVELRFDVQLKYEDGFYAFEFPMVVGSRYIPGNPNGKPGSGWGENPDTDRVPDASKITPPVSPPDTRSGRSIKLALTLAPGARIRELYSPTHTIRTSRLPKRSKHATRVVLASKNEIPNKDFVVRYRLTDKRPAMGVVSHMDARGGFLALRFEPPARPLASDIASKEMVFVVDTSESMGGESMELVREALRYAIANLNANDTFRLISFSSGTSMLGASPLANTPANRERALGVIKSLVADGGAETLDAVKLALDSGKSAGRLRIITFLSNGLIGNEKEVLSAVADGLDKRTRLFAFGIGAAPNRYLLERMAQLGGGTAQFMLPDEPATKQIERFYQRLRSPVLTDIEIDWKGLGVEDVRPRKAPDIFVGQPLSVVGRFARPGQATIEVRGRLGDRRVVYEVPVRLSKRSAMPIARLWARTAVKDLELEALGGTDRDAEITSLGLTYQIVTRKTSFVALAEDAKVAPGDLQTIMVPVDAVDRSKTTTADGRLASDRTPEQPAKPTPSDSTEVEKPNLEEVKKKAEKIGKRRKDKDKRNVTDPNGGDDGSDDDGVDEDDAEGDDDDDEDLAGAGAEPESRVATGRTMADSSIESAPVLTLSGSSGSTLGYRWRLGVSLGLGSTSGAQAGESRFASATALTIERIITSRVAVGAGLGLLLRGPTNDRIIGNVLFSASALNLLGQAARRVQLELSAGVGPSFGNDSVGIGVMGALKLRIPIPVGLQLRYDGALRFGDDETTNTVTGGFEFSF